MGFGMCRYSFILLGFFLISIPSTKAGKEDLAEQGSNAKVPSTQNLEAVIEEPNSADSADERLMLEKYVKELSGEDLSLFSSAHATDIDEKSNIAKLLPFSGYFKYAESDSLKQADAEPNTGQKNKTIQRVTCKTLSAEERETSGVGVKIVNDTSLQQLLKNEKLNQTNQTQEAVCQTLLLFAPWCAFSAEIAPYYNALARAFPDIEALAINAVTLNYWNARFGTVAVPNILLFHNGKFVSKFNHTQKDLESLTWFVQNFTTLVSEVNMQVTDEDFKGPVPAEVVPQTDWYLYLSWLTILVGTVNACTKFNSPFRYLYSRLANIFNQDPNNHPHFD